MLHRSSQTNISMKFLNQSYFSPHITIYYIFLSTCTSTFRFTDINKMTPRFWLSLAFLIYCIGLIESTAQCRPAEYSVHGMFLKGHTFKTVQVTFPAECDMICEQEARCQSYNVIIGRNICELNSRTKEARPDDFMADWNRFYMRRAFDRGSIFL